MANDTEGADEFDWRPLGQERWRELAQSAGASELQLRFAVAKFSGATNTAAARLSGYSGDKDALRRAGYAAARSTAVSNLLELASINSPVDAKITEKELDAKIAKMVRSPDSNVSIKAIELHAKRAAALKAQHSDDAYEADGLLRWRLERDALQFPNGASAYILVHGIHNLKLLHDTHHLVMREEFGPEIWSRLYAKLNDDSRAWLDGHLADPSFQLEVRKQVWAEINKKPPGPVDANAVDWRAKGLSDPAKKQNGNGAAHVAV